MQSQASTKPARNLARKALLATTLAATATLGLAAPAQADPWRGGYREYHHRGGGDAGLAIGAGLLGLAVGAAVASSDRPVYYRERFYEGPAYYPAPVYYEAPAYVYERPYPVYYRSYYRDDWRWHHRPHGYYYGAYGWRR